MLKIPKVTQNLHTPNQSMQVVDFIISLDCVCIDWEIFDLYGKKKSTQRRMLRQGIYDT